MLTRNSIVKPLVAFLETHASVNAVWEGGAAGWKRVDEWSDIDLVADVNDADVEKVMDSVKEFLEKEFGIDLQFDITQSPWPQIRQCFFRLKNCSPFLLIDFCIFPNSATDKFLEVEIHGEPVVHFDRKNIVQPVPINPEEQAKKLAQRIPLLQKRFEIFQVLVEKEINRGNHLEAFGFYLGFTVQPLVEMLRIVYAPHHSTFGTRYIQYDLPAPIVQQLTPFYFMANAHALKQNFVAAKKLFAEATQEAYKKYRLTKQVG